ncbi:MAG: hypothetical protein J3K34DRAFT_504301, partial [Monoraphidium minutum]
TRAPQTGEGEKARATTASELEAVLGALAWECNQKDLLKPVLSFDHATTHIAADVAAAFAAVTPRVTPEVAPLAPRMPDGNKVVEHRFPTVRAEFFDRVLSARTNSVTAVRAQRMLREAAAASITAAGVARDAASLPLTMKIISHARGVTFTHDGSSYTGTGAPRAHGRRAAARLGAAALTAEVTHHHQDPTGIQAQVLDRPGPTPPMDNITTSRRVLAVKAYILGWGILPVATETYARFNDTGSVADRPRSGRPPLLSRRTQLDASRQFKSGFEVSRVYKRGQPAVKERHYFRSINKGVAHLPFPQGLCTAHNLTPAQLLQRMCAADPSLIKRRLDLKAPLSLVQMTRRQSAASAWLEKWAAGGDKWLRRMVWIDEATIYATNIPGSKIAVWCDAHDAGAKAVYSSRQFKHGAVVKIRFYISLRRR